MSKRSMRTEHEILQGNFISGYDWASLSEFDVFKMTTHPQSRLDAHRFTEIEAGQSVRFVGTSAYGRVQACGEDPATRHLNRTCTVLSAGTEVATEVRETDMVLLLS